MRDVNAQSPGERAVARCEIEDVFLVESSCRGDRNVNQMQMPPELTGQFRLGADKSGVCIKRVPVDEKLPPLFIARYFITGEVRILAPGITADEAQDVPESDILARIKLTFGVDYKCPEELISDHEALGSFTKNAAYHVWPFLREAVHELVERMRLPRFIVPMLKPDAVSLVKLLGQHAPDKGGSS